MNKICIYCEKHKDVTQCRHCKKYFCSEHITPIEPGSYHPEKSRVFVNQIRLGYEKTHPCPDYVDYLEQQKKIESHRWGRMLDRLTGRAKKDLDEEEIVVHNNKKYENEHTFIDISRQKNNLIDLQKFKKNIVKSKWYLKEKVLSILLSIK